MNTNMDTNMDTNMNTPDTISTCSSISITPACCGGSSSGSDGGSSSSRSRPEKSSGAVSRNVRSNSMGADTGRAVNPEAVLEIHHKSSKELYKAVAKQYGLTCKLSSSCPCLECQSCYFDCNFVNQENGKEPKQGDFGDGGLGATTPMFVSEVMAGAACSLL